MLCSRGKKSTDQTKKWTLKNATSNAQRHQITNYEIFLLFLAAGFALWGIGDVTTGLIGGSDKAISASKEAVSPREVAIEFERTRRNYMPNSSVDVALQDGLLSDVMGALSREVLSGLKITRLV